jgi:hypothetical protein
MPIYIKLCRMNCTVFFKAGIEVLRFNDKINALLYAALVLIF